VILAPNELIVDNFAGGGGASTGIFQALGRSPDIAVNHNPEAMMMHLANHPDSLHYCEDVWNVDPVEACGGRPVGLLWLSPDCTHFSKAKGGKPVSKRVRGLAWIAVKWAKQVRPKLICLENVEEFREWGPVVDGQPCPDRKGKHFDAFVNALRRMKYDVQFRELRACDYGAPTTRKRLFLIARCDGEPIEWPVKTHGPGLIPFRTAASCIDWTIPTRSIFDRERPLADATLRRIAHGVMKYVVNTKHPYIVPNPPRVPILINTRNGERHGRHGEQAPRVLDIGKPMNTITALGSQGALVTAFLAKHNGIGAKMVVGQSLTEPTHTITGTDQKALVAAQLVKAQVADPLRAGTVYAFLVKFYGSSTTQQQGLEEPLHTITAKERFALVIVDGEEYVITDIGMRMLAPRELYKAQGFPDDYIIGDDPAQGLILPKSAQVRMCGNSVCPPVARAIVEANCDALVASECQEEAA
jgi:DNA (cytosine-5)-methyltransferase 1